jgi:outer membrane protein OmpA-like peptidoglycan-associated protein
MDKHKPTNEEVENPFALSIGDLMAALLLIFVLLLSSTLLQLQDEFDVKSNVAERYTAIKEDIYNQLMLEFKEDLVKWNATIDSSLTIRFRFKEPDVLFKTNEFTIQPNFKSILAEFFPRYIKVISKQKFIENIEEIRIEGHTDSDADYYYNMKLSQDRTRSVLEFVLDNTEITLEQRNWIQSKLTANGLSYSRPIADNSTELGKSQNRRVEFRIRTNAEKQIDEILKYNTNE